MFTFKLATLLRINFIYTISQYYINIPVDKFVKSKLINRDMSRYDDCYMCNIICGYYFRVLSSLRLLYLNILIYNV